MENLLMGLCLSLLISVPAPASTGDLSGVIESFMAKQFPRAQSHFWVVNGTQWQAENEVVVDLNTVVTNRASLAPTESRFLLLIVNRKPIFVTDRRGETGRSSEYSARFRH